MKKRQIALDTETTGINKFGAHYLGHKIIEIAAVEILDRKITGKKFHTYLNPRRLIDKEAYKIHNIKEDFLKDKPLFKDKIVEFIKFIKGSDLIIHNARFDVGFINNEINMLNLKKEIKIDKICTIIDSLNIARKVFPCKKNNLNDLCFRLSVNNKDRKFHSALLDANILAEVFLKLTSNQIKIDFDINNKNNIEYNILNKKNIKIIYANKKEILSNNIFFNFIKKKYINN
ncbi:DNA polymerase III epsilon subunit [endosymbiont of Sipalinus gigas]|uniref:DNA polymerase III subunit epsilon n=1 Tax=endosymbiont of Sipalinus gigas TaxID=1972134 RepID=UPI000DC707AF|nr:DNA polymerase III subunit epsilon [endosymbiont of Sipalinus gigas]BBA85360.1 DNA polymerase III epsilon subunit [endosymbiont of Sipalinus gigas]